MCVYFCAHTCAHVHMVLYYTDKSTEVKEYLKIPPAQNPSTRPWNPEFQHGTEPSDRTPTLNRNESSSDIYLSSPLRGFAFSLSLITLRLSEGGRFFPLPFRLISTCPCSAGVFVFILWLCFFS